MPEFYRGIRKVARSFFYIPIVKRALIDAPLVGKIYLLWKRTHPFENAFGVDTSGYVPVEKINADRRLQLLIYAYAASQPGIARKALQALASLDDYTFVLPRGIDFHRRSRR